MALTGYSNQNFPKGIHQTFNAHQHILPPKKKHTHKNERKKKRDIELVGKEKILAVEDVWMKSRRRGWEVEEDIRLNN